MSYPNNPDHKLEDDFCGAAGALFEDDRLSLPSEPPTPQEIYTFESRALGHLNAYLSAKGKEQASLVFDEPEALTQGFKAVLLEVLRRKKKETLRDQKILTVSHPDLDREEQVPFLSERSEVPTITVRVATSDDLEMMASLRDVFPELMDARNAIKSNQVKTA